MKQDILEFKNEFTSSIESLKSNIDEKFNIVNIRTDIKKNVVVIVAEGLIKVKDSIMEALKAENLKLQQKVEKLENAISELSKKSHTREEGEVHL